MLDDRIKNIFEYYEQVPGFKETLERAFGKFFESVPRFLNEKSEILFNEWLIFDFHFQGKKTLLKDYIQKKSSSFGEEDLVIYDELTKSIYGLFEVIRVDRGKGLLIKNTRDGKEYYVKERRGTFEITVGKLVFVRISKFIDHYEFVSGMIHQLPVSLTDSSRDFFMGTKDKLSPKVVHKLIQDSQSQNTKTVWPREELMTLETAEKRLKEALVENRLDGYVTTEKIKYWIENEDDFTQITTLHLLMGLVSSMETKNKQALGNFIEAFNIFYNLCPQKSLKGKSPNQKVHERYGKKKSKNQPEFEMSVFDSFSWGEKYMAGMEAFKKNKIEEAIENYNKVFEGLLKARSTDSNIFRFFTNKAMAHLSAGDRFVGEELLKISLEINPSYKFASEQLKMLREGQFDERISYGLHEGFIKRQDELEKIKNLSVKEILKRFAEFGYPLTAEEFIRFTKSYVSVEDLAEKELYPKIRVSTENEDQVWQMAEILWEKLAPEEPSFDKLQNLCFSLEDLEEEMWLDENSAKDPDALKAYAKAFSEIEEYLSICPKKFFDFAKKYIDYDDCVNTLVWFLMDLVYYHPRIEKSRIKALARGLNDKTFIARFSLLDIGIDILSKSKNWEAGAELLLKSDKNDSFLPSEIASIIEKSYGKKDKRIESYQSIALERVKKRHKIRFSKSQDKRYWYENDLIVLDNLCNKLKARKNIEFLNQVKEEKKIIKDEIKALSKEIEADFDIKKEKMEESTEKLQRERLEQDPAYKYWVFLKQFEINFSANEDMTNITYLDRSETKKVGRNEPCPCGAVDKKKKPVKYKKCCGK